MDKLPSLLSSEKLAILGALASVSPLGALIEVGVYQGGSARILYEVANKQERELWLYDTFSGIPFQGDLDQHRVGDFSYPCEAIKEEFPKAIVMQGIFPNGSKLPEKISFVHLDVDQYQSYRESLDVLLPQMVAGGMILCDDYCLPGAQKAIDETIGNKNLLPDGRILFKC